MTKFERRVLMALACGPIHPEYLYEAIWPDGPYYVHNLGSAGGGPSRAACAVNWHLGRIARKHHWVERIGQGNEPWRITRKGIAALNLVALEGGDEVRTMKAACSKCNGSGWIENPPWKRRFPCPKCSEPCARCGGSGFFQGKPTTFETDSEEERELAYDRARVRCPKCST